MANPDNGQIQVTAASYQPAQSQVDTPGSTALGTYAGVVEAIAG